MLRESRKWRMVQGRERVGGGGGFGQIGVGWWIGGLDQIS